MPHYLVCSYFFVLIKICYVSPIIYIVWQVIWPINTLKFRFTLVMRLFFKISQRMRMHQKSYSTLFTSSPNLVIPLPGNQFPNKFAPKVPYSILRNPLLGSFDSLSIVLLSPFSNSSESSRHLTIFIMLFT